MVIELGHPKSGDAPATPEEFRGAAVNRTYSGLRGMVCDSVGPIRHEVSIPFHDSQVRGIALLIQTGWDRRWGTESYWEPGPFLGQQVIFRMVRAGVRLVGVDFPIIEGSPDTLLITTCKIAIVQNLRDLASLPRVGFHFSAIPLEALEASSVGFCHVHAIAEII